MHSAALAYIEAVARCGSVREAARQMDVSSSSITRQIQNVEHRLGIRLFERGVDGMRPTPGGEILIEHIRRTLRDLERTRTRIEAAVGPRFGVVTMTATDSIATSLLPNILSTILERSPGIRFKVAIQRSVETWQTLIDGKAEIGLSFGPTPEAGLDVLLSLPLRLGVLVAADHPLAVRDSLRIKDVLAYPIVVPSADLPLYRRVDRFLRDQAGDYEPWVETDSFDLIKCLVETGRFVAFRTVLALESQFSSARTVHIPIEDEGFPLEEFVVAKAAARALTQESQWALEYIVSYLRLILTDEVVSPHRRSWLGPIGAMGGGPPPE